MRISGFTGVIVFAIGTAIPAVAQCAMTPEELFAPDATAPTVTMTGEDGTAGPSAPLSTAMT